MKRPSNSRSSCSTQVAWTPFDFTKCLQHRRAVDHVTYDRRTANGFVYCVGRFKMNCHPATKAFPPVLVAALSINSQPSCPSSLRI
jgi:hypothetical protein